MSQIKIEPVYTVEQVAEFLSCNPSTVRRMLASPKCTLKGFRVGTKLWRVRKSDLETYIQSCATEAAGA
ncbi:excisionase family DNA binding protein [Rhodothalassium salexigens DSM 2132]|uniref:Excisionase family DNA binding protein n=1 Tax=Rhodothalassium salexigens DSM 2132 TaxID=1188247 RepID=A0A4V2SNQ9_RHOSA|nr:hypothetical protein [Rhodothalassium salexigens DSM 2132]TCP32026.1 excisionase family DNA binding protein [Rhodothalassium salexigens DSM 2132]